VGCYDSQVIQRITAIRLDECGRIPTTGENPTPALKGLAPAIINLTRTRQVDPAPEQIVKLVTGGTCSKPRGTPTDRGWQFGLNFCGANPVFEALVGYKTLDYSGADIVGFEDVELTGTTNVALEVIFKPSADTCAVGESAKCMALLVPMLESWIKSGDETYNGETVPDLAMTSSTRLNKNLFANYATSGDLPAYLDHWAPKFADVATGRSWSYTYLIDCPEPDDSEDPCVLVGLDSAS
jgi:hypothetical protein